MSVTSRTAICGARPYPVGSEGDDGTECVLPKGHDGGHDDCVPVRVNQHGSECPGWCHIDHEHVNMHLGRVIDRHISTAIGDDLGDVRVTLITIGPGDQEAEVRVSAFDGFVFVSPDMAGDLADLIESLADCSPARLHGLADELRMAAQIARDTQ